MNPQPNPTVQPVHCRQNHIYFRCNVTIENVFLLCNLINEYNEFRDTNNGKYMLIPKPLYIHITSDGGNLFAGFMAYDYIKNSKIPCITVVEGYAFSAGAIIFLAGSKRLMTEHSYIMVHQLSSTAYINKSLTHHQIMDDTANCIELMSRVYGLYLNGTRHGPRVIDKKILTKEFLEKHVLHDIYWNTQLCIDLGIVDDIFSNNTVNEKNDLQVLIQNLCSPGHSVNHMALDINPSALIIETIREYGDGMNFINNGQYPAPDKRKNQNGLLVTSNL